VKPRLVRKFYEEYALGLYEYEDGYFLSIMRGGAVDLGYTFRLSPDEVAKVKDDPEKIRGFGTSLLKDSDAHAHRGVPFRMG
jgi:hypothetical protein